MQHIVQIFYIYCSAVILQEKNIKNGSSADWETGLDSLRKKLHRAQWCNSYLTAEVLPDFLDNPSPGDKGHHSHLSTWLCFHRHMKCLLCWGIAQTRSCYKAQPAPANPSYKKLKSMWENCFSWNTHLNSHRDFQRYLFFQRKECSICLKLHPAQFKTYPKWCLSPNWPWRQHQTLPTLWQILSKPGYF